MTYQALQIHKDDAGYRCGLHTLEDSALPEGNVTVQVDFSTINYKDGLAITGKSPVVRKFPLTPGIDLAGTVTDSQHPLFQTGDRVVLNGWGVGESHSGGLAQKARLQGDWLVKLPGAFTPRQAMAIGTAGYTAMLCVMALENTASSRPTARCWSPAPTAVWAAWPSHCCPVWVTPSSPPPGAWARPRICRPWVRPA